MIELTNMTRQLAHFFLNGFQNDPAVFEDANKFTVYRYSEAAADAYWERQQRLGRIHLAITLGGEPIGEIILKNLDHSHRSCTLSIHLKEDSVKNRGFGTRAEILALEYAFDELEMETVYADVLEGNPRSRHVLEKVGFREIHRDAAFHYYKYEKAAWNRPDSH